MTEHIKTIDLAGIETRLVGDPNDAYFKTVEQQAAHLGSLAALVRRHVPADANVLDVGANIGLTAILLARLTGRVTAYEPSPANLVFLRRNLSLNNIANVQIVAAAASDKAGTLRFHIATFGAGSHVVASGHLIASSVKTDDVPALSLDSQDHPPISFIKLDVEGHEPDALAGARLLIERDRPLIFSEVNVWCLCAFAGHSPGAFIRTLWEKFEVGKAEPDGEIRPLPDPYVFLHETIVRKSGVADIVLRPRPGASMPTLPDLTWPLPAVEALRDLARRESPFTPSAPSLQHIPI